MSAMFSECIEVYPLSIGIAERGFSDQLTAKDVMAATLKRLVRNGIHIRSLIPDHPKRAGKKTSSNEINGMANLT